VASSERVIRSERSGWLRGAQHATLNRALPSLDGFSEMSREACMK